MARRRRHPFFTPTLDRTIERVAIAALAAIATRGEGVSVTLAAITIFVIVAVGEELGAVGFGTAKEYHFVTWLSALLESSEFVALEISLVIHDAGEELALDRETVLRYLVRQTSAGSEFRSDGHIITFR